MTSKDECVKYEPKEDIERIRKMLVEAVNQINEALLTLCEMRYARIREEEKHDTDKRRI